MLKLKDDVQFNTTGNAATATQLKNARTLKIGNTGKTFNGTSNITWTLDEIGSNVQVSTSAPTSSDVDVWINPNGQLDISSLWSKMYPVGSIFISTSSTSPASLFGGTWTKLENRFLLGAGSSYTAGNTGGSATTGAASGNTGSTTLTVEQMPSHSHAIMNANSGGSASGWNYVPNVGSTNKGYYNMGTANAGGGQGHTHTLNSHTHSAMPPYLVVYMWKRTA